VNKGAIDHIGYGLEAAVGMPWGTLGLAWSVLDFSHLVHMNKWIEIGCAYSGEGAAYWEAFSFVSLGSSSYGNYPSWNLNCGVDVAEPWKHQEIFNGNGWHFSSELVAYATNIIEIGFEIFQ
jgi:hypothetical protein